MFKKLLTLIAVIAIVFALAVPQADAALRHFKLDVYKATTAQGLYDISYATRLTDNVYYSVYRYHATTPSGTRETLYVDKAGTALGSNPWVSEGFFDNTGTIDFYCDPNESGDSKVRLLVIDAVSGKSVWMTAEYDKDHTVIIDERPGVIHMLTLPLSSTSVKMWGAATSNGDTKDTGINFALNTTVLDMYVDVTAAAASTSSFDCGSKSAPAAYARKIWTYTVGLQSSNRLITGDTMITTDSDYADIVVTWTTDSPDGFLNLLHITNW